MAGQKKISFAGIKIWLKAARPFTFTASVIPVLLGGVMALSFGGETAWPLFLIFLVCSVLFHAATNLINDYYDFQKGVDKEHTFGSSGVLVRGELPARDVLVAGRALFAIGFFLGLLLVSARGWPIFILGVAAIAGGYAYTGQPIAYKYSALGDLFVFLLMGVLLVGGAYFTLTGVYAGEVFYVSLPIGALVTAILHSNNLRDRRHDIQAGIKTLAVILGHRRAQVQYYFLILFAYLSVLMMVFSGMIPGWAVSVFLSVPLAVKNMRMVRDSREDHPESLAAIDVQTAKLHFIFGVLLILSILAGAFYG
ncbi:MAG: 1,4-dihydroxy-2-naphthoate octaprenyltransferase [Candidatus Omnitrophota bacterium]